MNALLVLASAVGAKPATLDHPGSTPGPLRLTAGTLTAVSMLQGPSSYAMPPSGRPQQAQSDAIPTAVLTTRLRTLTVMPQKSGSSETAVAVGSAALQEGGTAATVADELLKSGSGAALSGWQQRDKTHPV